MVRPSYGRPTMPWVVDRCSGCVTIRLSRNRESNQAINVNRADPVKVSAPNDLDGKSVPLGEVVNGRTASETNLLQNA